jgi:hypothetical protein
LHQERRSTTWTVAELTKILLQLDVDEESEHNAWIQVLEPIELHRANKQKRHFPCYRAFWQKYEDDMDTSVKPFVDPQEVAKVCKNVHTLLAVFNYHVYPDRSLQITNQPMVTF